MKRPIYILIFVAGALFASRAEETNAVTNVVAKVTNQAPARVEAPASSASAMSKDIDSFDAFKIITQRNIFDPNRTRPGVPRPADQAKPARIDYLNLVGAMSYEKGQFAFFDGSSSEYRKSVKPGDSIAGYKVADVTQNQVTLESDGKKIELPVGGQLKRVDDGEWKVNESRESFAEAGGSSRGDSGRGENDRRDRGDRGDRRGGDRSDGRSRYGSSSSSNSTTSSSSSTTDNKTDSSSGPSDALQRLLEARKKEGN